MTIICKSIILPAPVPPFVGTKFAVSVATPASDWGIYSLALAEGHDTLTINWGDGGDPETYTGTSASPSHTYAAPGEYEVRVSDDVSSLGFSHSGVWKDGYASMLRGFSTNATLLKTLIANCFWNCRNMRAFSIADSGVYDLKLVVFRDCTALAGRIDLPGVRSVRSSSASPLFQGCTGGITEIHFDSDMEEPITHLPGYDDDPTLGTGTAVCKFDL